MKRIKGSSSRFVNQERLTKTKFGWGRGYGVFSVSESNRNRTVEYIRNQEKHHMVTTFENEVELFLKKYEIAQKAKGVRNR